MAYTLTTSDGSLVITIPDGHFDNTTSLTLPGPNAVGYGQFLDQNILQLLENFASNTSPSGQSIQGQLWYNKSSKTLNVFTGDQGYLPVSGIIVSGSQPLNANAGNTWYDTTRNQYFFYDGTSWNLIGPIYNKAQGVSGAIPSSIGDASLVGVYHNVLVLKFGNLVLATLNGDSAFTPTPAIDGFPRIFHGLTLNNNLFPGNNQFYTNANTAAYLPVDPTIVGIQNNVSTLTSTVATNLATTNANIVTANSAVVSYVNTQISLQNTAITNAWTANARAQETAIGLLNANVASTTAAWQANAVSQDTAINLLNANVTAANLTIASVNSVWQANAASQQVTLDSHSSTLATKSPIDSPTFTGTPKAPTPPISDTSGNIATTSFVKTVVNNATGSLGTMSTQNLNNVNITGGNIIGSYGLNAATATYANTAGLANNATHATTADAATTAVSASYATAAGNGGVVSVNGQSGAVTLRGLGLGGERWHPVGRGFNIQYYNGFGYPIAVSATASCSVTSEIHAYVDGNLVSWFQWQFNGCGSFGGAFIIVPPGSTYQLNSNQGVVNWVELY